MRYIPHYQVEVTDHSVRLSRPGSQACREALILAKETDPEGNTTIWCDRAIHYGILLEDEWQATGAVTTVLSTKSPL